MDHGKCHADAPPEGNLPHASASGSMGKEESNLTFDLLSYFVDLSIFSSGDHPGAAHDAHSVAQAGSSSDSADSYNGDDARHYRHEWNAAIDRYSEATRESGHLEFAPNASQAALATAKGEANAVHAQLVESDGRVAGKILQETWYFL